MHAETETIRQQQSQADEPTVFHYISNKDIESDVPSVALCGEEVRSGADRIIRPRGHSSWIVCPICEFIHSMSDDEPRLEQWLQGIEQLEKNGKGTSHE
ncbi:MAG: hypothetical protein ABF780_08220 [Bifidobacterium aquikefiri]|uniref:Uncharacterized protein n=1 Tax=Bifidobacterium aquikefiri TaxID=1653207 RepID=A0A261G782_9BIFI|nr:hypothetical protein [Bifidobacterium aquikefiri]OZG67264.1 hypothetical protein BAQU_1337 [Bifidobacterium aquikefiri]